MQDAGGDGAEQRKSVLRELSDIDLDKKDNAYKLSFALLRTESLVDSAELAALTESVLARISSDELVNRRFIRVERDHLGRILEEQDLSAMLASKDGKLALGNLVAADMLLVARVRQDAGSVEIVLNASSTETGVRIASHIDAAGPSEMIDDIVATLALRLVQEFPRLQGIVLDWTSPDVVFDLTQEQRIRPYLKCIVFEPMEITHPVTNQSLGTKYTALAEGTIQAVGDTFSEAEIHPKEEGGSLDALPIAVGNYVVIK